MSLLYAEKVLLREELTVVVSRSRNYRTLYSYSSSQYSNMTTEHKPLDIFALMINAMHFGTSLLVVMALHI